MRASAIISSAEFRRAFGSPGTRLAHRSPVAMATWNLSTDGDALVARGVIDGCDCSTRISARVSGAIDARVPVRSLVDVAGALTSDEVRIEQGPHDLVLHDARSRFHVYTLPRVPGAVPVRTTALEVSALIEVAELVGALAMSAAASSEHGLFKDVEPVQLTFTQTGQVVVSSTDHFHLAEVLLSIADPVGAGRRSVSTSRAVLEFGARFIGTEAAARVSVSGPSLRIEGSRGWVGMPTLVGYAIPDPPATAHGRPLARIDRTLLLGALDQVGVLSGGERAVTLTLDSDSIIVASSDSDLGTVVVEVPALATARTPPFRVRRSVLRHWLRAVGSETVTLSGRVADRRLEWRAETGATTTRLLMATIA